MRWLAILVACSPAWTPAGVPLDEGRLNNLAATSKYQSKQLRVSGAVYSTGMRKIDPAMRPHDERWPGESSGSDGPFPFIAVRDSEHPTHDLVVCLFTADEPPKLASGVPVHLVGYFQEYMVIEGHVELILNRCSVGE
jgi:hypothetical protein